MAVATTLSQASADANNQAFIDKITVAMVVQAWTVTQEASSVSNHAARLAYAVQVRQDPLGYGRKVALDAVANGLAVASSDSTILTTLAAGWTQLAGVGLP